jgi:hypothetical protein
MAKRFTDTEKWKKPFIRGLQGAYKLLWLYICDDCDHAGIWQVDFEVAKIRIGEDICLPDALECFGDKIIVFDNGNKWFIPSFIEFQYPSGLNPDNRAHNSIIILLEKYNLLKNENKPLTSLSEGRKDMDKDMDMDMDKDKVKGDKKIKFRDNITLTEKENTQLNNEYGSMEVNRFYDYLSAYKIEKSYKTKSDYLTIKRWVVDAVSKMPRVSVSKNAYQAEVEKKLKEYKTMPQ